MATWHLLLLVMLEKAFVVAFFFKVTIVSSCWVQVKKVDEFFNTCPVKLVILIFAYNFILRLQHVYLAGWLFLRGLERDFSWVWIPKLKISFTLGDRETHSSSSHSPGVSFSLYLDATKWRTGLEVQKMSLRVLSSTCAPIVEKVRGVWPTLCVSSRSNPI